jgi:hypothetical protein
MPIFQGFQALKSKKIARNCQTRDQCGGFVGQNKGAITHSYYDKETSGKNDRGNGFVPRTTAQMKTEQNFVEWDFLNIWYIEPDQYPRLRL